jgi:hypothetical protein
MEVNTLFHESLLGEKCRVVGKKIVEGMITVTVVVENMPRLGESATEDYSRYRVSLGKVDPKG